MTWGLVAAGGATLLGGMMGSDASENAADAQVQAAHEANVLNRDVFNKQIELNDPYRRIGLGAGNRLMTLLGLTPGAAATGLDGNPAGGLSRDALRSQLLSKYTSAPTAGAVTGAPAGGSGYVPNGGSGYVPEGYSGENYYGPINAGATAGAASTVDEAGLNAEIDRLLAQQQTTQDQAYGDPTDPEFGSLMKDFSMADYQADPGYAFRLSEGTKARERMAAARGGLLSGRAAKDMERFSQGLASDEFGAAYNRFRTNKQDKLNPLQSLMGVGQTGTGAMTSAAGNYGANAGGNITGAGNATAAGTVGSANALNGAIGQGVSQYTQNQLMNKLFPPKTSNAGNYWASDYGQYL